MYIRPDTFPLLPQCGTQKVKPIFPNDMNQPDILFPEKPGY